MEESAKTPMENQAPLLKSWIVMMSREKIKEINSGIMAFKTNVAANLVGKIKPNPKKNEYYLTDAIEIAYHEGIQASTYSTSEEEVFGVNSKRDLAEAEKINRKT